VSARAGRDSSLFQNQKKIILYEVWKMGFETIGALWELKKLV
jgi:hypothetical protein